jgi:uncharacterized membrane protein
MNAAEIIQELPKLTDSERRAIRQALLELAIKNEDIAACNQAATDAAVMFDRMEEKNLSRR